jgi:hypothetical protein
MEEMMEALTIRGVEGQPQYRNTLGSATVLSLLHENLERVVSYRSYARDAGIVREIKALEVVIEQDEADDSLQARFERAQRSRFDADAPVEVKISGHKAREIHEQLEIRIADQIQVIDGLWYDIKRSLRYPELYEYEDGGEIRYTDRIRRIFMEGGIPDEVIQSSKVRWVRRLLKYLFAELVQQQRYMREREIVARCRS